MASLKTTTDPSPSIRSVFNKQITWPPPKAAPFTEKSGKALGRAVEGGGCRGLGGRQRSRAPRRPRGWGQARERRECRCSSPGEEGKQKSSAAVLCCCVWLKQKILDIRAEKSKHSCDYREDILCPQNGLDQYRWFADHAKTDGLRAMERWDETLPRFLASNIFLSLFWFVKQYSWDLRWGQLKRLDFLTKGNQN